MEERDVIIVGGGPAGYAAAIRSAQLGRKATVIEKETLGGTCLNSGCVPFMVLAKAVELLDMSKGGKEYGITFGSAAVDFEKLSARRKMVTKIHVQGVKSLLEAYQTEVLQGSARLISPSEVEVTTGDGKRQHLRGASIIIAAGTRPSPPTMPGDEGRSIDTNALLELPSPPASIAIVGGGFVSLTIATILAHLGSKVTVVEESARLLPEVDEEITGMLARELKKSKIQVLLGARAVGLADSFEGQKEVEIEVNGQMTKIVASVVLRTGRLPDIDGLGLAALGLNLNEAGGIAIDPSMETSVKSLFAAGDVTMRHMYTPVAYAEGLAAAENIAGRKTVMDYTAVPYWSNTIPAICGAGLTEAGAIEKGYAVRVGRFPLAANAMATILGRRTGMVKMVTDAQYGQILGVHVVGHNAQELVHEALLAMRSELTPRDIARAFHVHPSLSESLWDASRAVDNESINSFNPA